MASSQLRPRAYLIANPSKPQAVAEFEALRKLLADRGQLAGASILTESHDLAESAPDRAVVLGGDGSILAVGRASAPLAVPIIGVNLGKLGYLAAYSLADFHEHFDAAMSDPTLVSNRMTLEVAVREPVSGVIHRTVAINDCVIHCGPPYRVLVMELRVDGESLAAITADGLIISTPTGSTAHNLAGGGPLLEPEVDATVLTPICPHSFTHRPIVMSPTTTVTITVLQANPGSAMMIDGQVAYPLAPGSAITIQRGATPFRLVRHPHRTSWQTLVFKLKWGQLPTASLPGV